MKDVDFTIPSHLTAKEFGKVKIHRIGKSLDVEFTILMEPEGSGGEGWQTGVAIDGSASMRNPFGKELSGKIPPDVMSDYEAKKWVTYGIQDGRKYRFFQPEAYEAAVKAGYMKFSENIIEPLARDFVGYLAGNLDADGGTTLIYWACGDGSVIEEVGDFTEAQCKSLCLEGPKKSFGIKTNLVPAIKYFVNRFADAKNGMYIFITDGKLDDLPEVKNLTTQIAHEISQGKRNPVKFVLIGVGDSVDEKQMEELDNLDTGTDMDLWDHKIAKEMRALVEIFSEVVEENQIIAPTGIIVDSSGKKVKVFSDGLPAKINVSMDASSEWFELEVAGRRIRQTLLLP